MRNTITFDDVLLTPQYSEIVSRKSIDISSALSQNIVLDLPIIAAPMDTVTNSHLISTMNKYGATGVLHRYNSVHQQASALKRIDGVKAGAVGVTGDYVDRAMRLIDAGATIICIDVAHGHHALVRHALKVLRNTLGHDIHIMVGNVATLEAFNDLADWGADSIKVGIGGGSICSTRVQTGHGVPTLQSVLDCARSDRDVKIIADGGIKSSGDMVKAIAAGADFVMVGSLLAGTIEAPGDSITIAGKQYKKYRGMASIEAQIDWRGHTASVEGVSHMVPAQGRLEKVLKDLEGGIRSGFSYTGALNIVDFQSKAEFVKQTSAGLYESRTHIKDRF